MLLDVDIIKLCTSYKVQLLYNDMLYISTSNLQTYLVTSILDSLGLNKVYMTVHE